MARTAAEAGFERVIGFDMGGTSTDVCHYAGEYERAFETVVAGVRMRAPMMNIHTVAAGGGSICIRRRAVAGGAGLGGRGAGTGGLSPGRAADGHRLQCHAGQAAAGVLPRRVRAQRRPAAGRDAVAAGFEAGRADPGGDRRGHDPARAIAEGFVTIAVENMAKAVRQISIQRGYDVTRYVLACFGGAGGQHACLVADALGMTKVMIHPFAGVLSAYGMGLADLRLIREATVERPLAEAAGDLAEQAKALAG
jgi:5-oxoprolinase (ATP-hydrolysing)